jgi:hypothetical protein
MRGRGGKQDLTLSQQLLFLRASPTVGGAGTVRENRLTWHTSVQPTPLARSYQADVAYSLGKTPTVRISEPDLELLAQGRPLPHVYTNPLRLCLHLPGIEDWDAAKRIDQTIIPWTYTWLFYFEDWLATDDWKGGGRHPGEEPEDPGNRALRRAMARF